MRRSSVRRVAGYAGIQALVLVLLCAGPAPAFVLSQVRGQNSGIWFPTRWPPGTRRVAFFLCAPSLQMLPNLAPNSEPAAALQSALQTWSLAPLGLSLRGQVSDVDPGQDGVNLVTLANTPKNRDIVQNFLSVTLHWYGTRASGQTYFPITETDIVVSSQQKWATDGSPGRYDLQSTLTHDLGTALGLSNSAVMAATMFRFSDTGRSPWRIPEPDDLTGLRVLYSMGGDTDTGEIAGKVLTTRSAPVFGAHVVAAGADGIVRAAVLTEADGSFRLPLLPIGDYEVYAEPLNGITTPADYTARYQTASTGFRTTFAGSARNRSQVSVASGETTTLDPIHVEGQRAALVPLQLAWSSNGDQFSATNLPLTARPGDRTWLVLVGEGMDAVLTVRISGHDLFLDMSRSVRGTTVAGPPYLMMPLSVQSGARPGARSVILDSGSEVAAFTGGIKVVAP